MEMPASHILLVVALVGLYAWTFFLAPRFHAWSGGARWVKMSWYVEPKAGSIRAWIERDRPRLHRVGAWLVTKFFLYSIRSTLIAVLVAIVAIYLNS